MEPDIAESERYYQARKKVREIKDFYQHLMVFILVSIILIVINLMTSPEYLWFVWCLMGWMIGLILHGLAAFNLPPFFDKEWEAKKIREILEKDKNKLVDNHGTKLY